MNDIKCTECGQFGAHYCTGKPSRGNNDPFSLSETKTYCGVELTVEQKISREFNANRSGFADLIERQNKEIADLKAQLQFHDDEAEKQEDINDSLLKISDARINALAKERDELRAQNQKLTASLHLTISHEWCDDNYEQAKAALRANKQQCLARVKADAEKKGYWQGFETGTINQGGNILEHYSDWLEFKAKNERCANKLREGKS